MFKFVDNAIIIPLIQTSESFYERRLRVPEPSAVKLARDVDSKSQP
jgi:hypothetical protein